MIDLYAWPAPNGHRVQILVEELASRIACSHRHHPRRSAWSYEALGHVFSLKGHFPKRSVLTLPAELV